MTSDPLLVNSAAFDFQLRSGSSAADGGTPVGLATDIAGRTVPQGSGYPIGAYEFVTGYNDPDCRNHCLAVDGDPCG